ncbi:MAG: ATP-binding cassette domain-containing protein [Gordonibacter pamelaeae]
MRQWPRSGPRAAAAPALRVEGLAYRYARHEVAATCRSLWRPGALRFSTGPNGAGKSTLLRCVAGWDAPAAGAVELAGRRSAERLDQRRTVRSFPTCPPSTTT